MWGRWVRGVRRGEGEGGQRQHASSPQSNDHVRVQIHFLRVNKNRTEPEVVEHHLDVPL